MKARHRTGIAALAIAGLVASAGVASAGLVASAGVASAAASAQASGKTPATFIAVSPGSPDRLAIYSGRTGRRIKFLTAPAPGGGVFEPVLSANGKTVVFSRGRGTCGQSIDTVPAGGGRERVLIPLTGSGNAAVIPGNASLSADGKYLIYGSFPCDSALLKVHLRTLRTGHTVTGPGRMGWPAVFIDHDTRVVFVEAGRLALLRLPSMRVQFYRAPRDCVYQSLTGTTSQLSGMLQCGPRAALSVVAISTSKLDVSTTLARLGSCLGGQTISVAPHDPSAFLAETYSACSPPQPAAAILHIVKILNGKISVLLSGPSNRVPQSSVW
jgi:hypothetical protein